MESQLDVAQLIHNGGVFVDVEGSSPQEVYKNVCKKIKLPSGLTSEQLYQALCDREQVLSTAVGNGIALPHARSPIVKNEKDQKICVVYLKKAIDMKAPDERFVSVMFILLTQNTQLHLKVLSELAGLFRDGKFRKALEIKSDEKTLYSIIKEMNS